jgi:WD40 repeat protein/ABC-type oligopeptide transport system substrate-binding subunit
MTTRSIYTVGGTVQADKQLYLTRKADEELLAMCRAGTFAYILAPRQIGKSSLLVRTSRRLNEEGVRSVIIDLTQLGTQVTAEAWYLGLLAIIEDQLMLDTDVLQWWRSRSELGITQRLTQFFEEIIVFQISTPVVIFVDEIDTTLSLSFTDDFFAAIRYFYQARARLAQFQRLSFVLMGVATPGDLIQDASRTPFNIGQRLDMTDFTLEEALPLAEGLGLDPAETRQMLEWVLNWTGGHPYLTQRLCQVITEQEGKNHWTRDELAELVQNTFFGEKSEEDNNLQFVRDMLLRRTADRRGVLTTYKQIRQHKKPVRDEERSLTKTHLKLAGLVRREYNFLLVRNRIYQTVFDEKWIRDHLPINWTRNLQRAAVALIGLLLVASVGLSIYAFILQGEANSRAQEAVKARGAAEQGRQEADNLRRQADAEALAFRAINASSGPEPELGLLLAIEAAKNLQGLPDERVESALRQTLLASPQRFTLHGHNTSVTAVAFSPDGKLLATSSLDGVALVWETGTGKLLTSLPSNTTAPDQSPAVSFSPDGQFILTNSDEHYGRVWEVKTGRLVSSHLFNSGIHTSRFSPDGKTIISMTRTDLTLWETATGSELNNLYSLQISPDLPFDTLRAVTFSPDGKLIGLAGPASTARVLEAATGKVLFELGGHSGAVNTIYFSPDSQLIATASDDKTARVWEAKNGNLLYQLNGHSGRVLQASFSPDNRLIVTTSDDKTARLWEAATGKPLGEPLIHLMAINNAAFSPDNKLLVTSNDDNMARVWEVETGKLVNELRGHTSLVLAAIFSPDSRLVVTASADSTVRLWSANRDPNAFELAGHTDQLRQVSFSPDGKLVVTASADGTARLWETVSGKLQSELKGHNSLVSRAAFSPDGKLVATASWDNTVRIWEKASGKSLFILNGHTALINSVAFSADGKRLVSASNDQTARVWEVASGKLAAELKGHNSPVNFAAFSPDGKQVLTLSKANVAVVWESASGKPLFNLGGKLGPVYSAEYSPDGKSVVTASIDNTAQLWEASTGRFLSELKAPALLGRSEDLLKSAAFSPDGKLVVTAGNDHLARVWEIGSGNLVAELRGHTDQVNQAIFSPNSRFVLTVSEDRSVRLWEAYSGLQFGKLGEQQGTVNSVAFSPDGKLIATASDDGIARLFNCELCGSLADLTTLAQNRVTRSLTPQERQQYGLPAAALPTTGAPTPTAAPTVSPDPTPGPVIPAKLNYTRLYPPINLKHAVTGGTFHWGVNFPVEDLDPVLGGNGSISHELFDGLVELLPDLSAGPAIASTWSLSADGTTYTFKLRQDVQFSNGDPVTASDFIYSWRRALSNPKDFADLLFDNIRGVSEVKVLRDKALSEQLPENQKIAQAEFNQALDTLFTSSIKAPDDYTLVVTLLQPGSHFLTGLTEGNFVVVDRKVIEKYGEQWTQPGNLVGTGPFVLKEWTHGQEIRLEYNPNYFQGRAGIDTVIIDDSQSFEVYPAKYAAGKLDDIPIDDVIAVSRNPQYQDQVYEVPLVTTDWLAFNLKQGPFARNQKLRAAFFQSIDRQQLIEGLGGTWEHPTTNLLLPGFQGYQPYDPYPFDPVKARQLLKQAGYDSPEKLRQLEDQINNWGNGKSGGIVTNGDTAEWVNLWQGIQQQLKENLGLNIKLYLVDNFPDYNQRRNQGEFLIYRERRIVNIPDAQNMLQPLFGCQESRNVSGYCNPQYDRAWLKGNLARTQAERNSAYQEAERLLLDDAALVPIANDGTVQLTKPYIKNWGYNAWGAVNLKYMEIRK